jgi:isoquinoline 1-oxidoreductase beta subunit
MIVAAELGAAWGRCRFEQAPADDAYGGMTVGGSDSVADYWMPLRHAGATARELLVRAAAARWGAAPGECTAADGRVRHEPSGRTLSFGALATEAAGQAVPDPIPLRPDERLIGPPVGPVDAEAVVTGRATYGLDVRVRDGLIAVVDRAPVHGATVASFDASSARRIEGVVDVLPIEPRVVAGALYGAVRAGVAVLATDTWAAMRGRDALEVRWNEGPNADLDSDGLRSALRAALDRPPDAVLRDAGGPGPGPEAGRVLRARYDLPLLAHACMEPVNFTAGAAGDRVVLRGPTQNPRAMQAAVAEGLGLDLDRVEVHPTLAGGGFGRRLAFDYGVEAAFLSRAAGRPVTVVWTREDDLRQDYYRPPSAHALEAVLDGRGRPLAWRHHLATGSLLSHTVEGGGPAPAVYDVQGGADLPYVFPHTWFGYSAVPVGVQLGSFRSVAHSFNVFAVESFLDEIAHAGERDPLDFRLSLLREGRVPISLPLPGRRGRPAPDHSRLRRVLRAAAERAAWNRPPPTGIHRGLACCYYKETYVAHVVEVDARESNRVHRVIAAVDAGRVINSDGARAQIEGAAMDAVATVFRWSVTLERGRVREGNFDAYRPLRIDEAPDVDVVMLPSSAPPSGMGEPPYPSAVPAITNALFAATGARIRRLPLTERP